MTSTEIKTRLRDIKLEAERLRRELRRLEPKPKRAKVKVRKVKSAEERERERKYAEFRELHPRCWRCNRTENDYPHDYGGWFMIERSHITKDGLGKRCEDVRLINALCTFCHALHTGGFISTEEMLALKAEHDPGNYDPEFLQRHSLRRLSFPTPPRGQRA